MVSRVLQGLTAAALLLLLSLDTRSFSLTARTFFGVVRTVAILAAAGFFWPKIKAYFLKSAEPISFKLNWQGSSKASLLALVIYAGLFATLTHPLLSEFSSRLYADNGDGLQMLWNVWWFERALSEGRNPFFTDLLHHPMGASLLGATYHPLKCLLVAPLVPILGAMKAYNVLFIETFLVCCLSVFLLSYVLTKSFIGSLAAGFVFGFWGNRFAHANGHMHVISTEFIPLFVLSLLAWFEKPRGWRFLWPAFFLFCSLMTDYYSFLCNVFIFVMMFAWATARQRRLFFLKDKHWLKQTIGFTVSMLATSGVFVLFMVRESSRDPWSGGHSSTGFSMDLLAPFTPSLYTRFAEWARPLWEKFSAFSVEGSTFMGWTVIVLAGLSLRHISIRGLRSLLLTLIGVFFVLALGPYLHIGGKILPISLPYLVLENTIHPIRVSGIPARLSVVVILFLAVLVAFEVKYLWTSRGKVWAALACALLVFEYQPVLHSRTLLTVPASVAYLRYLPGEFPMIDLTPRARHLYFQTIHGRPLAFGYIARIPQSRKDLETKLRAMIDEKRFGELKTEYGFRYILAEKDDALLKGKAPIFTDEKYAVYRLD